MVLIETVSTLYSIVDVLGNFKGSAFRDKNGTTFVRSRDGSIETCFDPPTFWQNNVLKLPAQSEQKCAVIKNLN